MAKKKIKRNYDHILKSDEIKEPVEKLPTPEQTTAVMEEVEGKTAPEPVKVVKAKIKSVTASEEKKKTKPYSQSRRGRKRFNTMLKPKLKNELIAIASKKNLSVADVLERAVKKYIKSKKSNS